MYDLVGYAPPPPAPRLPASLVGDPRWPQPGAPSTGTRLLPPPPDDARLAEVSVSRDLQAIRTPDGNTWAEYMDHSGATTMWKGPARLMREHLGPVRGAIASARLLEVMGSSIPGMSVGQPKYDLKRPFQLDPSVQLVGHKPNTSSYPSGHSRMAYAAARVISHYDPSQAASVYDLAQQVAMSRVYAGAHLPSDVLEGARFGVAWADRVLHAAPGAAAA